MIFCEKLITTCPMEVVSQLEDLIDSLLQKQKALEEENASLKAQLDEERQKKQAVLTKIDGLLKKLQEANA